MSRVPEPIRQAILAALQAGRTCRDVAAECKVGLATVHRIAKANGIVNGHAKALKAARAPRPERGTERNGTAERNGTEQGQLPASDRSGRTIDERLYECTKAASNGVIAAGKCLDRGMEILARAGNDSPMLHAAAALVDKGASALARVNGILRLNAGLPDSYAKSETRGEMTIEHVTAEQAREVLRRELGLGHVHVTEDAPTVPS